MSPEKLSLQGNSVGAPRLQSALPFLPFLRRLLGMVVLLTGLELT